MARSTLAFMVVAALFLSSTMAQSPASSPTNSSALRKALSPSPVAVSPSPAVSPSSMSPAASPFTEISPPSPPTSTSESPATAPAISPSSIFAPPSEVPGSASNGAVLNRVTVPAVLVIFAAALLV